MTCVITLNALLHIFASDLCYTICFKNPCVVSSCCGTVRTITNTDAGHCMMSQVWSGHTLPFKQGCGSCLDLRVAGKVIAAVCHGPAGLVDATGPDGKPVFNGKRVTGFCNTEEEAVGKTDKVPFLLEDRMKGLGGKYEKKGDWNDFSIADGRLVTGDPTLLRCQNPFNLRCM